jgi:hypothetical protein
MSSRMVRVSRMASMAVLIAVCAFSTASAQPGPEVKKLSYFVGKWQTEVELKATPSSPGGKATGTEDCEWFANLHVVCRADATGAAGNYRSMRIISYVPLLKQYSQYSVDSLGYAVLAFGQTQGDNWTFITDMGQAKLRTVLKTSSGSYATTTEYAGADGKYVTTATGKMTRAK